MYTLEVENNLSDDTKHLYEHLKHMVVVSLSIDLCWLCCPNTQLYWWLHCPQSKLVLCTAVLMPRRSQTEQLKQESGKAQSLDQDLIGEAQRKNQMVLSQRRVQRLKSCTRSTLFRLFLPKSVKIRNLVIHQEDRMSIYFLDFILLR